MSDDATDQAKRILTPAPRHDSVSSSQRYRLKLAIPQTLGPEDHMAAWKIKGERDETGVSSYGYYHISLRVASAHHDLASTTGQLAGCKQLTTERKLVGPKVGP